MRADYFERFAPELTGGLKKLAADSEFYTQARIGHVPTDTSPGHASIATGQPPSIHGVVGNEWLDQNTGLVAYSAADPINGIGPTNLMTATLGDRLKDFDPASRVISISYKDRAAAMMGGRKADTVVWYNKKRRRFGSSGAYKSDQKWLNGFNNAHQTEGLKKISTAIDPTTSALAKAAIDRYELGQDDHCDLLMLSFSATDLIGHVHGPDSEEMRAQLLVLDNTLNDLLSYLEQKTGGDFVLALSADHGVTSIPERVKDGKPVGIRLMDRDLQAQLESACHLVAPAPPGKWVLWVGTTDATLNRSLAEQKNLDWKEFLSDVTSVWKNQADIAQVYATRPAVAPLDDYSAVYQRSYFPGRSGDLFLRANPGVIVIDKEDGTTHGTAYDDDARVPLLFYSRSIPARRVDERVFNDILAGRIAREIGLSFPE